jgi:hypothetical protein
VVRIAKNTKNREVSNITVRRRKANSSTMLLMTKEIFRKERQPKLPTQHNLANAELPLPSSTRTLNEHDARTSQSYNAIPAAPSSTTNVTTHLHLCPSQFTDAPDDLAAPSCADSESLHRNTDLIVAPNEAFSSIENTTGDTKSTPLAPWEQRRDRKRKLLSETLEKEAHPIYQVKRSKKWPLQQRAIEWIRQAGKAHFDRHFATLLAQWGVKETHKGTCVLLPADWAALDPLKLASIFNAEHCPRAWADGVVSCLPRQKNQLTSLRLINMQTI